MGLKQKDIDMIIKFVKKEPRTIQDVSRLIKRSWVTTDSYLQQVKDQTGVINIKTFRKGTQGALKLVYYNYSETLAGDDLKEELYNQLKIARNKEDFDFFEIFQFVPDDNKRIFHEENIGELLRQAERMVYAFSGNLSFINKIENGVKVISLFEELAKRKVFVKILCRVNIASLNNISRLLPLMQKYPEFIEIRHCYQPLRGFVIDDSITTFKNEESLKKYKEGELSKDIRIFYEVLDREWISWIQKIFWNLFRTSIDYNIRARQFKKFF